MVEHDQSRSIFWLWLDGAKMLYHVLFFPSFTRYSHIADIHPIFHSQVCNKFPVAIDMLQYNIYLLHPAPSAVHWAVYAKLYRLEFEALQADPPSFAIDDLQYVSGKVLVYGAVDDDVLEIPVVFHSVAACQRRRGRVKFIPVFVRFGILEISVVALEPDMDLLQVGHIA